MQTTRIWVWAPTGLLLRGQRNTQLLSRLRKRYWVWVFLLLLLEELTWQNGINTSFFLCHTGEMCWCPFVLKHYNSVTSVAFSIERLASRITYRCMHLGLSQTDVQVTRKQSPKKRLWDYLISSSAYLSIFEMVSNSSLEKAHLYNLKIKMMMKNTTGSRWQCDELFGQTYIFLFCCVIRPCGNMSAGCEMWDVAGWSLKQVTNSWERERVDPTLKITIHTEDYMWFNSTNEFN